MTPHRIKDIAGSIAENGEEGCFIVNVERISSACPKLSPDIINPLTEDEEPILLYNSSSNITIFTAKLIDYYINKKIQKR